MTKPTFGEQVAELRTRNKMTQAELADLIERVYEHKIKGSTIGRIEHDAIPFTYASGAAIIRALRPDAAAKVKLDAALAEHLEKFVQPTPYTSGTVLARLMEELEITNRVLSEKIGVVHQAVQGWRAGSSLMSDEMLTAALAELTKRGVPASRLRELTRQHIYDVLMTMPRLTYLTKAQRKKLASLGADII